MYQWDVSPEYVAHRIITEIESCRNSTVWTPFYVYVMAILRFLPLKIGFFIQFIAGSDRAIKEDS
jgi:hypothetical protein